MIEPIVGDVGWNRWEELDFGHGGNFGWPCFEGPEPQPEYQALFAACAELEVDLFDTIVFQGSANDAEDGELAPEALRWTVLHLHDDHQHGFLDSSGTGGSLRVPDFGSGEHALEFRLTATDSTGLTDVDVVIVPITPWLFSDDFEHGHLLKWSTATD